MAITFLGGVPDGFHVCHQNGIKTDCRLQNLRIDTASANCMDKVNHGTHNRGEFHYKSKYTQELILQVKKRLLSGEKILDLCREYGMTRSYLSNIKHGYKWGWLEV